MHAYCLLASQMMCLLSIYIYMARSRCCISGKLSLWRRRGFMGCIWVLCVCVWQDLQPAPQIGTHRYTCRKCEVGRFHSSIHSCNINDEVSLFSYRSKGCCAVSRWLWQYLPGTILYTSTR